MIFDFETEEPTRYDLLKDERGLVEEQFEKPLVVEGIVVKGDQRGRELGFPTANLAPEVELPDDGVFAGYVTRANGTKYVSAISIGRRPTYYGAEAIRLLEAFLLDFDDDLYGEHIIVEITQRIRGQLAFSSSEELIDQIAADVDAVRAANTL